jgi:hypothetical protein
MIDPVAGDKWVVEGRFAKVLRHLDEDRGMTLIEERSRCVRLGELHEIVVTDRAAAEDDRVRRVGFLGFAEMRTGGVIEEGDEVRLGERLFGRVMGFDGCHFPNHYNIVIRAERLFTGTTLGVCVADGISFSQAQSPTISGRYSSTSTSAKPV